MKAALMISLATAMVLIASFALGRVNFGYEGMRFCVEGDGETPAVIPRTLYRTWKTKNWDECPSNMKRAWDATEKANPRIKQILFDDDDMDAFMRSDEVPRAWSQAYFDIDKMYPAAKADVFRYVITYARGGLYLDNKSAAGTLPDELFEKKGAMLVASWPLKYRLATCQITSSIKSYGLKGELAQWWLACSPRHPVMRRVIENVVANIEREARECATKVTGLFGLVRTITGQLPIFNITGPWAYTDAVLSARSNSTDGGQFCVIGGRPNWNGLMVYDYTGAHVMRQMFGKSHYSKSKMSLVKSCNQA